MGIPYRQEKVVTLYACPPVFPAGSSTDESGEKFIIGIMRETTERRLAAQKHQDMERKFSVLMNNLSGFAYRCKNDSVK